LVFSQVPRCQGLCGSQKYTRTPVLAASSAWRADHRRHWFSSGASFSRACAMRANSAYPDGQSAGVTDRRIGASW
jgi:hypothetical protein